MVEPAAENAVIPGDLLEAKTSSRARTQFLSATKVVAGKFDIDLSRPIAEFEHDYAEAFECASQETGLNDHVAVVVKGRYPIRRDVMLTCLNNEIEGLMVLRTVMTVTWPGDEQQRQVIIFRRPSGNALLPKHSPRREPLSEDLLRRGIIRPVFYALRDLAERHVFHGNVRPDNIFLVNHENAEAILGECISSIPGINQPWIYETIERGMADTDSKGIGTSLDDIYAFGVSIAILCRGHNPLESKPRGEVIEDKINRGSYAVLTDGLRLSPGISEFLRATLNDDPRQRWGIEHLASWVDGNRATPKQSMLGQKAQRVIEFNGNKYLRPKLLARDLFDNVPEAVTLIESGHITKWYERALGDQEGSDMITAAIGRAGIGGRTSGYEDRLLCFVSMALDPRAPIRFKDLRFFPTGLGYALCNAYLTNNKNKMQTLAEVIRDRYAWIWMGHKENSQDAQPEKMHVFDHASKTILRRGIDFGLERCLYELCKDAPCLSDMLKNYYVNSCSNLIHAMNDVAEEFKSERPMDRHIASFISVHDNRDNAGFMSLLESTDRIRRSLALITLYQSMQKRFDNPKLVGLTQWLVKDAEIVAERFRSLALKEDVIKSIPKEAKTGNLTRVITLIDSPMQVRKDETDFVMASRHFIALGNERDFIQRDLTNNPDFGHTTGRQVAMFLSIMLAGLLTACVFIMRFTGPGF